MLAHRKADCNVINFRNIAMEHAQFKNESRTLPTSYNPPIGGHEPIPLRCTEAEQICQVVSFMASNNYDDAVPILKELEKNNNFDAQNLLGDLNFCGIGTDQDFSKAINYYEQAAQNGDASSSNNLGYAVQYGLKNDQKFEPKPHEAMRHYLQAFITAGRANNENTDFVEGILQNLTKKEEFAVNIYDSGEHMTPHSYFLQMAGSYELSNTPDLLTAFAIIKNACLLKGGQPDPSDLQALNELQENILASVKDDFKNHHYPKAYKKLFFLAKDTQVTKENQATAMRLLGKMYCQGLGVAQHIKQAINFLNVPAKQGDKPACYLLGEIYSADTEHFDYEMAMHWYELAGAEGLKKIEPLQLKVYESVLNDLKTDKIDLAFTKLKWLAQKDYAIASDKLEKICLQLDCLVDAMPSKNGRVYHQKAFEHFLEAIKKGYQPAYFMAGKALEKIGPAPSESQKAHQQKVLTFYDLEANLSDSEINCLGQVSFAIATVLSQSNDDDDKLKLIAQNNFRTGKSYLEEATLRGHPTALDTMFILSEKYLRQYEDASLLKKNKVDLEVGTRLFEFALAQEHPKAVAKEKANAQQIEQEKKAAQEAQAKLQREKEQKEKEWEEFSKNISSAISTAAGWFTSSEKSFKNPFLTFENQNSQDKDEGL